MNEGHPTNPYEASREELEQMKANAKLYDLLTDSIDESLDSESRIKNGQVWTAEGIGGGMFRGDMMLVEALAPIEYSRSDVDHWNIQKGGTWLLFRFTETQNPWLEVEHFDQVQGSQSAYSLIRLEDLLHEYLPGYNGVYFNRLTRPTGNVMVRNTLAGVGHVDQARPISEAYEILERAQPLDLEESLAGIQSPIPQEGKRKPRSGRREKLKTLHDVSANMSRVRLKLLDSQDSNLSKGDIEGDPLAYDMLEKILDSKRT